MSLLLVAPENNTNCKIQQNIVYFESDTRLSLFVFQFSQDASAPLAAYISKMGFILLRESGGSWNYLV